MDKFDTEQQKPYSFSRVCVKTPALGVFVARLKRILLTYVVVPIAFFAIQSCNGIGYQGGSIPTTFSGIDQAKGVSPQSIQLTWTALPGAAKYFVYSPDKNDPVYTPYFNQLLIKPTSSDSSIVYQYSVTALDSTTGKEQGLRSFYMNVSLLPHFNFKDSGSIHVAGETSLRVNWNADPSVSYQVYVAERLPTGKVDYNNFVASTMTVTGKDSALITGLLKGHEYCAVVVAAYSDQTNDTPNGTLLQAGVDVGTTLSSDAYSKGVSGSFGDSIIAQSQKCARTEAKDLDVTNLKIYVQKASLSSQPVFYVSVPGDVTEDSTGTLSTAIYQVNEATGLSTLIGSRIGTGKITAQTAIPSGRYKFFAVASALPPSTSQVKTEIIVGPTGSKPATELERKWVYIRSFNASEASASSIGYYPEKQQAGYGSQRAGSSVAIGDFNCDGKKDLAIGIPDASLMSSDNRPAKQGKVIIYYDTTTGTPTTTTRTQTINFDITGFAGDAGRDLRLGTSLYVGNFNGDNQSTNQYGGSNPGYSCDDLVIGSGYGPMFVLYGKRDVVDGDGGLNYDGPTSFSLNPSTSCDPSSNVCQVAVYTQGVNYTSHIGLKMTSGDYNGDGYEDLAATSSSSTITSPRGIWVFRGSEYGLIAPNRFSDTVDSVLTDSASYLGFPFLPSTVTSFVTILPSSISPTPTPSSTSLWAATNSGFASSISTLHNAYYDTDCPITNVNCTTVKGTKRIRDVLLIGNKQSKQVHACIPKSDMSLTSFGTIGSSTDVNTGLYWDCSSSINSTAITASTGVTGFGDAMVDFKNPLRYYPRQFTDTGCAEGFGNCSSTSMNLGYPGGVAISSITAGAAYVYFGVNNPNGAGGSRDFLGISRNKYLTQLLSGKRYNGSTALQVVTGVVAPCGSTAGTEYCDIQQITHPTTSSGSFGAVLAALSGNEKTDPLNTAKDTILAIAAPYRSFALSGGNSYSNVGSVQLYRQNSGSNPLVVRAPCDETGVCRLADGFSTTLTEALNYDGTLTNNIYFGLGGIVAGALLPTNDSGYNSNSDIVVGAPGHVAQITQNDGLIKKVIDNGAAITFFSHSGIFRNYQPGGSSATASVWHQLDQSFSQESDMKFHQAISIGDINQDGIGDVAVRINQGTRNRVRIYHGKTDKVGLNTSSSDYSDINIEGDSTAGMRFVPIGNTTSSTLPTFLMTGSTGSYIMFGGIGGIVGGYPSAFGTGGPRKLTAPDSTYLSFSDSAFYNAETTSIDSTINPYTNFAHGDFNGDGYEDFAIGFNGSQNIGTYPGDASNGRVMVFYGGADNGFQTQPDLAGGYPLATTHFTEYSADSTTHSTLGSLITPCATDGTGCKIQMIHEATTGVTDTFGKSITSVPAGTCTNADGKVSKVSSLIVQAVKTGVASLYVYRPKCLDQLTPNDFSGLISNGATSNTTIDLTKKTLPIPSSSATYGIAMVAANKLMGALPTNPDIISHLVVTDQTNSKVVVYPITFNNSNTSSDKMAIESFSVTADGGRVINYATSSMLTGTNGTTTLFGSGLASLGDVNGDGYGDIGIGIAKLNRKDNSSSTLAQGSVLVIFGSPTGLQSHTSSTYLSAIEPSRTASCYIAPGGAIGQSICNPTLLYLPQLTNSIRNGTYERASLLSNSFIETSSVINEGMGTFIMGSPGRDSLEDLPTQRILQGGAFYVLP